MSTLLLDSGPLGVLTNPGLTPVVQACRRWAADLQAAGWRVILPEIVDYELRREFLHRRSGNALSFLDWYGGQFEYLALDTKTMQYAADLWATARRAGIPTAAPSDIDIDIILAAQALMVNEPTVVVATTNVIHLSRFVAADLWQNIHP